MLTNIKSRCQSVVAFVEEHPTLIGCALSAVVASKMTSDYIFAQIYEQSYEWGKQTGQLEMLLDESYAFIKEQGLEPEFVEFANMVVKG